MDNKYITHSFKKKYSSYKKPNNIFKFLKINKKSKNNDSDSDSDSDYKNKKSSNIKNKVYITNNHLYFHANVTEKSVDAVKKLMREYAHIIRNIKNNSNLIDIKHKPLFLHIFSPGGCVYAGLAMYDFISEYKNIIPVYTIVEGFAASSATFMSIAGTKRFITPSSYMLIHQLSTIARGNFEQIKEEFQNCDKIMEKIMDIYLKHTNISKDNISEILKHDINWNAQDCIQYGIIDEIKLIDTFNDHL